tara:strand:+ start:34288 stop:34608 length:321 start_codon:yes stop_codon:yes gene_type:complete
MGFLRHSGSSTLIFPDNIDRVYKNLLQCLDEIGSIKEKNDKLKRIVFKAGFSYNFANVSIQLFPKDKKHTEISFSSNVFDGLIGLNSANRIIERIIKELTDKSEEK